MITALLTLVLAFQTNAPYVSRIPIDPENPPAIDRPSCVLREDPPRFLPDEYLDLRVFTEPITDPAIDPNTGQNVFAYIQQPINVRSTLPAPWTQLVIECQATDDQWKQIVASMALLTAPIVIAPNDGVIECAEDGSAFYYNPTRRIVVAGDWWRWQGGFQCLGVAGPIVNILPVNDTPIPDTVPLPDPLPATVCMFMPGSGGGGTGQAWLINYPVSATTDPNTGLSVPVPCDASAGYAYIQQEVLSPWTQLTPFAMGAVDATTCLSYGTDWFYNTTTNTLKQCGQMLADDAQ